MINKDSKTSSRLYFRLLSYVKPYRRIFILAIVGMVILALTEAVIPALLQPLLDGTFVEKDAFYLNYAPLGIIVLFFLRGLADFTAKVAFTSVSSRVVYDLRLAMFQRMLALPATYYDQHATGNIISKLTYDVAQVTSASTEVLTVIVKDPIIVIGLLGYIFWLDWHLSLLVFLLVPMVAGMAAIVGKRLRRLSREQQKTFGDLTHMLEEATHGQKMIKIFGAQAYESSRLKKIINRIRRLEVKVRVASASNVPVVEFFGAILMAGVVIIGTARAEENQLTVGGFVAFFAALALLFSPIKRLTKINTPLQRGLAAAESIFALIDEQEEIDQGKQSLERAQGRLRFENIVFRYPEQESYALSDLNFTLQPGQTIALVGKSGSGKTTIASLLPRLYDLEDGTIYLDEIDIKTLPLATLRQQISLVSQDIVLFNDSVAGNIAYGDPVQADRIAQAAKDASALEFIQALPQGFDTPIGENGVRLSGGQRQRLAIARAMYKDAPILILDEATSALDTHAEKQVQEALKRLKTGRTTLVIAHRLSTIEQADQILVLDQGKLVEIGDHQNLIEQNGHYAALIQGSGNTPS